MAIHSLFPQPVGVYKLDRDLTDKEIGFIKGQETRPNMTYPCALRSHGLTTRNRGNGITSTRTRIRLLAAFFT